MRPLPEAASTTCPATRVALGCSWPTLCHGAQLARGSGPAQGTASARAHCRPSSDLPFSWPAAAPCWASGLQTSQTVSSRDAQARELPAAPQRLGAARRQFAAFNLHHAEPPSARLPDQTLGGCLAPWAC